MHTCTYVLSNAVYNKQNNNKYTAKVIFEQHT